MADEQQVHLCEVCSQPVPADQPPLKVGSCEFPFHVHDECRDDMETVAGFVEELCVLSDAQPEGLLNLGSWGDEQGSGRQGRDVDAETLVTFLDSYLRGEEQITDGPLNVENDSVYLHGWWPAAVRLAGDAYLVRADADPEGLQLDRLISERLAARGLRRCAVDDRLLESIGLQRLGLLGATWQTWAPDDETATEAVGRAAAG